jgi:Globin
VRCRGNLVSKVSHSPCGGGCTFVPPLLTFVSAVLTFSYRIFETAPLAEAMFRFTKRAHVSLNTSSVEKLQKKKGEVVAASGNVIGDAGPCLSSFRSGESETCTMVSCDSFTTIESCCTESSADEATEAIFSNPLFIAHARALFGTVDAAVSLVAAGKSMCLADVLAGLGRRHVHYGVLAPHYKIVGKALLHTLATALGDAYTPTVELGWKMVYGVVHSGMQEGAFHECDDIDDGNVTAAAATANNHLSRFEI